MHLEVLLPFPCLFWKINLIQIRILNQANKNTLFNITLYNKKHSNLSLAILKIPPKIYLRRESSRTVLRVMKTANLRIATLLLLEAIYRRSFRPAESSSHRLFG